MARVNKNKPLHNHVVLSDLHSGCKFSLIPPDCKIVEGGMYSPSKNQELIYEAWLQFVEYWIPLYTKKEDFTLVLNGDLIEGVHHGAKTQVSQDHSDQHDIASKLISMVTSNKKCKEVYCTAGTPSHVGSSAELENILAKDIGAEFDKQTHRYARWELNKKCGDWIVNYMHHVSGGSKTHTSLSGLLGSLGEQLTQSSRWSDYRPDVVVRSHIHNFNLAAISTDRGRMTALTTPAWQIHTPFCYKIAVRDWHPQIGGVVIRNKDRVDNYIREKYWTIKKPKVIE